ncbi:MAG: alpha/beta fold hydrolase [Crocinitomicaceae bacterium]
MRPVKPETRYTKSGDVNIAYQVFGSGPLDLVYIPGWVSNIDWMWACPELVDFLTELGEIARVILFDKRGTGLSDRLVKFPTLEERMDDIRAVMDAVDSLEAVLFGHSEGGSVSALFAATYPNRTVALMAFGIFAKRVYSPDYPWAPTTQERQVVYDMIEKGWGSAKMNLESLAPSMANDSVFMDWLANYFRSGASPSAALLLTKMNTEVDIINILGSINVPTLILQRTGDIDVKIEEGRFIADRIDGAKFIELEGDDHLFWTGNRTEVLEEMKWFILNLKMKPVYEKQLFTIVVGRLLFSDSESFEKQGLLKQYIEKYKGNLVQFEKETFIATFEGPSKAVHCSMELVESSGRLNAQVSIGIAIKECEIGNSIDKEIADFADTILEEPTPGQILLTQTVKNLLVGAGVSILPYRTIFEKGTNESLFLYTVVEKIKLNGPNILPQNDVFLKKVLQSIYSNLSNENFGVEMLCSQIGVSERQVQRKLKAIANKSPNQLISSVRLQRAKELILSKQDTIAEIAFQTGFSNPSYFSKCFKKEFSIAPSDLQNK